MKISRTDDLTREILKSVTKSVDINGKTETNGKAHHVMF